jgi:uncharacterized C2H2 Zn-finger protein
MNCDICNKLTASFTSLKGHDGEILVCCPSCVNDYEAYADYEYERQKEEGCESDRERDQEEI